MNWSIIFGIISKNVEWYSVLLLSLDVVLCFVIFSLWWSSLHYFVRLDHRSTCTKSHIIKITGWLAVTMIHSMATNNGTRFNFTPQTNHHWMFVTIVTQFRVSVAVFIDCSDNNNGVVLIRHYFCGLTVMLLHILPPSEGAGWLPAKQQHCTRGES